MSKSLEPKPAKLITSLFTPDSSIIDETLKRLRAHWGDTDYLSESIPFNYTDYYAEEMGAHLVRRFVSFRKLIPPDTLPNLKLYTNNIEEHFSIDHKRRVNIDPGYITPERLVLATGKNYSHRIYLRDGIYADLTLIFKKGSFTPLEWTYPDYAASQIIELMNTIRKRYMEQLRERA